MRPTTTSRWWFLDLVLACAYTLVAGDAVLSGVTGVPRVLLAMPLVLFLPGYVLLAVLYPAAHDLDPDGRTDATRRTENVLEPLPRSYMLEPVERVGLSVAFSVAIVPAIVLVTAVTPDGISLYPIVVGLCAFVVGATALAFLTRLRVPPANRYAPSIGLLRAFLFTRRASRRPMRRDGSGRSVVVFNVALVASVVVATAGVGYMVATPPDSDTYTEFYVNTGGVDGDTETWYPDTFRTGRADEFPVAVVNQEGTDVEYTAVVVLQRVDADGQGVDVREERELSRQTIVVADGERVNETLAVEPTMAGDDLRLAILLYRGDAPTDPSVDDAYRAVHVDVRVAG